MEINKQTSPMIIFPSLQPFGKIIFSQGFRKTRTDHDVKAFLTKLSLHIFECQKLRCLFSAHPSSEFISDLYENRIMDRKIWSPYEELNIARSATVDEVT